jgi:hypothetical protein
VKPLLYMDVNLGPGRTGRIGIHEGDDPKVLAKNFATSYRLDDVLAKRLEELIRENYIKNRIAQPTISTQNTPRSKTPGPEKTISSSVKQNRSSSAKRPQRNTKSTSMDIPVMNGHQYHPDHQIPTYHRSEISTQTLTPTTMSLLSNSPNSNGVLESLRELKSFTESNDL